MTDKPSSERTPAGAEPSRAEPSRAAGGSGAESGGGAAAAGPLPGSRRRFLSRLSVGLGALAAGLASVPLIGFFLTPLRFRRAVIWRPVGPAADFPIGETVLVRYLDEEPVPWAGHAARSAAWLRREGADGFVVFSMYCTHTGCPVTWSAGAQLFMCPCHGGTFHRDGRVAGGPPPRPLERLPVRVRNGQVEIQLIGAPRTG